MIELDELLGKHLLSGALVEVDCLGVIQALNCSFGDPSLLGHTLTGALRQAGFETSAFSGDGPTVDTLDQTMLLKDVQVTTDSLGSDLQLCCQFSNIAAAIRPNALQN
jgi:hypothetical protein